jgi:RND family efflux transporter MFP subunit
VTKGQPLARLDPQDARLSAAAANAQVAVADADLSFAKAELDRNKQLLDQKFISQAAYDNKLSAYRVASAKRDAALAQSQVSGNQAGYTTLVADSAGIITAVLAEAGQVVNAGQAVMRLARTEEREVWINVAESQAAGLQPGAPAQVSLWSQPQKVYSGKVREIAPAADALTRTYTVKVSVLDADQALRWGMTANVGIGGMRGSAVAAGAIVVPLTAIAQQGQQASVWVVGSNNAVVARQVQVAQYLENGALIAGGLKPGETIIVAGVHKLIAGEVIKPLPEAAVAAAAASTSAPVLAQNQPDAVAPRAPESLSAPGK